MGCAGTAIRFLTCFMAPIALLLILTPTPTPSNHSKADGQFVVDAANFNEKWNQWFRTYFGCPVDATNISQCSLPKGRMDYKTFLDARKAAKKLFDLHEK